MESSSNELRQSAEQHDQQQEPQVVQVVIGDKVYTKTVLPAFTRGDAQQKHPRLMASYVGDERYESSRFGIDKYGARLSGDQWTNVEY